MRWWMGIAILCVVLFAQTLLGSLQERCATAYGRAPYEAMFYFHAMSLPAFGFMFPSVPARLHAWSACAGGAGAACANSLRAVVGGVAEENGLSGVVRGAAALSLAALRGPLGDVTIMWAHVIINTVTQYICLVGVYQLISTEDQLTVNVVLTIRKFVSLMMSIWVFGNTFTLYHWTGALLVLGGSSLYSIKEEQLLQMLGWSQKEAAALKAQSSSLALSPGPLAKGGAAAAPEPVRSSSVERRARARR
jgi:UDP-xylose/UDP-N-acetylglucosamine transporter B4